MKNNVKKIKIYKDKILEIDDFGFNELFTCNCKISATVVGDKYVIGSGAMGKCFHSEIDYMILEKFGSYSLHIAAVDDCLVMWKDGEMSLIELDVVIGILNEIQMYYKKTNKNILIEIGILDVNGFFDCREIDDIVIKLKNDFNKEKVQYRKKFY